jgi:SET domain-containing protein
MYVTRDHVIDAGPYKNAKARFANDASGLMKVKGVLNNSIYVKDGLRIFIEATKNIPAGNEIFVDYGKDYWNTIKYNSSIDTTSKNNTGRKKGK